MDMETVIPSEIRRLTKMMDCPMCKGEGKTHSYGLERTCAFCGGDKIVKRSIVNQIAREQHITTEQFIENIGA